MTGVQTCALPISGKRIKRISVALSPFVPKAHTPFQWCKMDSKGEIDRKIGIVLSLLKSRFINIEWHDPETSILEGAFARGDRRLSNVIVSAFKAGAKFDGWREYFNPGIWSKAFQEHGFNIEEFAIRERAFEEALPWDHIDCGVKKSFLRDEYQRAEKGIITEDCYLSGCKNCGLEKACFDVKKEHKPEISKKEVIFHSGLLPEVGDISEKERERRGKTGAGQRAGVSQTSIQQALFSRPDVGRIARRELNNCNVRRRQAGGGLVGRRPVGPKRMVGSFHSRNATGLGFGSMLFRREAGGQGRLRGRASAISACRGIFGDWRVLPVSFRRDVAGGVSFRHVAGRNRIAAVAAASASALGCPGAPPHCAAREAGTASTRCRAQSSSAPVGLATRIRHPSGSWLIRSTRQLVSMLPWGKRAAMAPGNPAPIVARALSRRTVLGS